MWWDERKAGGAIRSLIFMAHPGPSVLVTAVLVAIAGLAGQRVPDASSNPAADRSDASGPVLHRGDQRRGRSARRRRGEAAQAIGSWRHPAVDGAARRRRAWCDRARDRRHDQCSDVGIRRARARRRPRLRPRFAQHALLVGALVGGHDGPPAGGLCIRGGDPFAAACADPAVGSDRHRAPLRQCASRP